MMKQTETSQTPVPVDVDVEFSTTYEKWHITLNFSSVKKSASGTPLTTYRSLGLRSTRDAAVEFANEEMTRLGVCAGYIEGAS